MYPPDPRVLAPMKYDWTRFKNQPHGFRKHWCDNHQYSNGENFNPKTVGLLISGHCVSNAGPKIAEIILAALADKLIEPFEELDEAA